MRKPLLSSRAVPGLYDLMLLLDPQADDERRAEIVRNVHTMIETSGSLVGAHDWGMRRMAYEIDHRPDAAYHLLQFEGGNDLLERLDHTLKITDGVLRFRTIRLRQGSPPPAPPRSERRPEGRSREDGEATVAPRAAADSRRPDNGRS